MQVAVVALVTVLNGLRPFVDISHVYAVTISPAVAFTCAVNVALLPTSAIWLEGWTETLTVAPIEIGNIPMPTAARHTRRGRGNRISFMGGEVASADRYLVLRPLLVRSEEH